MKDLVHEYFAKVNAFWPLLHRPSFEKDINDKLHLRDRGFASVLLCVCALGSRYVDSPDVFLDGHGKHQTAGWKWFRQINVMRQSPWVVPSLYDLQLCSVSGLLKVDNSQCAQLMANSVAHCTLSYTNGCLASVLDDCRYRNSHGSRYWRPPAKDL